MTKRLLVADDSATIQQVVKYCLGQEDVELVFARSAEEAYGKVRELRPDMLVVDTVLPGKSGYDLARALRNDPSMAGMPILLLASANEAFDENKARACGADGWIPKPFTSSALIEQVRTLLATSRPATRPPARPTQPPPARPSAAPPARPAPTQPPGSVRPRGVVPGTRPPPAGAPTAPPQARSAAASRPAPVRPPGVMPGTRPPPPRQATMPPGARPPGPGPVAAGRAPAPAPAPARVTPENHEALLREALSTATRDMLEKIAWEVVPELAETIIREELERLIKAKQE